MASPEPMAAVDLSPAQLDEVLQILARLMPAVEVRVFGSRAKGHAKPFSDLDLALMTQQALTLSQQAELNEAFDESGLPFRVDVLDWAATSAAFQAQVMAGSVVIRAAEAGSQ